MGWNERGGVLSDKQLEFCRVMAQGDVGQGEAAKKVGYKNHDKQGYRLMQLQKVKNIINILKEMQSLKSCTISDDLEAARGQVSKLWIEKKLVAVVLDPKTYQVDRIRALNLLSQLKGYLSEQAPAHLTPIILNYKGQQLGSLAGVSSAIEN